MAGELEAQVRSLIGGAGLGSATVAVSVRECSSDREVVSINARKAMIPASNMKLFWTGAALQKLGPAFRFRTELHQIGSDLVLVGDGDPTIADPETFKGLSMRTRDGVVRDFDEEAILSLWVDGVQRAGIDQVRGLRIDDRVFDREFVHPTWKLDQLNRPYSAEVAGLNFHANCMSFSPKTRGGKPDWSNHRPRAPWIVARASNKSKNATSKQGHAPWFASKAGADGFQFRGTIKSGTHAPVEVTVHDPPQFFANLLRDRMDQGGIEIEFIDRVADLEPLPKGRIIEPVIETPILAVVQRCNEESQNLYAEALLKRTVHAHTGRPGSWNDADLAMKAIILDLVGPSASAFFEGVRFVDGSGLSRENRVSAGLTTLWLSALAMAPYGDAFVESLAEGGKEGTLRKRFKESLPGGARVDAKSGYINGVSCLSGYVSMPGGRRYAFSVLVNNATNISKAKALQEKIVRAIAG